jgi:hypothetical protein
MKAALLAGIAALSLAIGTAHAEHDEERGTEYDCSSNFDKVWWRMYRETYGVAGRTITIHSAKDRTGRFPIVRFDVKTDTLTLNGKRCREKK